MPQMNATTPMDISDAASTSPQGRDSSHCVICLGVCVDRTVLETCHHEFCFHCILQWSIISHACPLCIRIFDSCIHDIRDDTLYTVHRFEPLSAASKKSSTPASLSSSSAAISTSHQIAVPYGIIRQLYGPPQIRRRARSDQYARQNETVDERSVVEQQQQALDQRRHVYRHRLFVKHVGANRISGFQQITPETFKVFPHKLDRLIPWIRRELRAILSLSTPCHSFGPSADASTSSPSFPSSMSSDTEHRQHHRYEEIDTGLELIREYIIAVLKQYDLQTDHAHDLLKDFLQEHTEQFVHELMAFARSPHSIEAYDRSAQYNSPDTNQTRLLGSRSAEATSASDGYDTSRPEQDSRGRDGKRPRSQRPTGRSQRSDSRGRASERRQDSRESPDYDSSNGDMARGPGMHSKQRRSSSGRGRGSSRSRIGSASTNRTRSRGWDRSSSRERIMPQCRARSKGASRSGSKEKRRRSRSSNSDSSSPRVGHCIIGDGASSPSPSTSHANPRTAGNIQDTIVHQAPSDNGLEVAASPSLSRRDVLAAMLQEKLKRERDLYDARNR